MDGCIHVWMDAWIFMCVEPVHVCIDLCIHVCIVIADMAEGELGLEEALKKGWLAPALSHTLSRKRSMYAPPSIDIPRHIILSQPITR
jgi:hypothetical protein